MVIKSLRRSILKDCKLTPVVSCDEGQMTMDKDGVFEKSFPWRKCPLAEVEDCEREIVEFIDWFNNLPKKEGHCPICGGKIA